MGARVADLLLGRGPVEESADGVGHAVCESWIPSQGGVFIIVLSKSKQVSYAGLTAVPKPTVKSGTEDAWLTDVPAWGCHPSHFEYIDTLQE